MLQRDTSFSPEMWPPNLPDLNPVDYSTWGIVVVVRSKAINYLHLVAVVLRDADND